MISIILIFARPELFNYRARSIQQSAKVGSDKNSAPYTAKGLLGTGQIGAVADTGADVQSCYLIDKNGNVPFSEISKPIYDKSRRKVIAYVYRANTGDKLDVKEGHGSHVAGTIAGAIAGANINGGKESR